MALITNKSILSCDIIYTTWLYIRTNRRCKTLQFFIYMVFTNYHYNIRMAIWKLGIDVSIDPFNKHIHISIGGRFSDYFFFQCYCKRSKTGVINPVTCEYICINGLFTWISLYKDI